MKMCIKGSLLKEGWPDHFLIMIQILISAGVVDCKSWLVPMWWSETLWLFLLKRFGFHTNTGRINQGINHPGREIYYAIYLIINTPDHPSFKRRGNFFFAVLIHPQTLGWWLWGWGWVFGHKVINLWVLRIWSFASFAVKGFLKKYKQNELFIWKVLRCNLLLWRNQVFIAKWMTALRIG
jgi:hypothetical protein